MNNEFYEEFEKLFINLLNFLNKYNQSEILQNTLYDYFKSLIYANLINNIFSNLTEENMEEYGISKEEVEKFQVDFKKTKDRIKDAISNDKLKEINAEYYKNFKQIIEEECPTISEFINKLELEWGIDKLDKYLKEKKQQISETGIEDTSDIEIVFATKILEEDFQKEDFLNSPLSSSEDIASKFSEDYFKKSMKIKQWNIWYSYSTFFLEDDYDLEKVAYKLVELDLCPLVLSQDLKIWWKEDEEVKQTTIDFSKFDIHGFKANFPKISDGYILEGLNQFLIMWHAEANLLDEKYRSSFEYIRGFMNPCKLKSGERPILMYPYLKLYNNGTVNLTFRQISPEFEYLIDSFIEHEVNLFKSYFEEMETSPDIMKLSGRYSVYTGQVPLSLNLYRKRSLIFKEMDRDIEKNTRFVKEGDFSFYYTNTIPDKNKKRTLDDLYGFFTSALAFAMNTNKKGEIPFSDGLKYNFGNYWTVRPSIYIIDFINQPYTAANISKNFSNQLGKIMARSYMPFYMDFSKFLGKNLREFDDYCLYMNKAITLWVFSKSGIRNFSKKEDPNLSFLYEKQVQVELIDHLNISLKRLFETSYDLSL